MMHLFEIIIENGLRLAADRIFQRLRGDVRIAVTIPAHPRTGFQERQDIAVQTEQVRQPALDGRNLAKEGTREDGDGVLDLVVDVNADRPQHARLPQRPDLAPELGFDFRAFSRLLVRPFAHHQQGADVGFAIEDALAPHLGRMRRNNGRQQRVRQIGARTSGGDVRVRFQLLQRTRPCLDVDEMVVGDVGELGKDGEGPNEERHLGRLELAQPAVEPDIGDAVAMFADRLLANLLNQVEVGLAALQALRVLAILFLDDRPEQASQKANDLPARLALLTILRCRFHASVRFSPA